MRKVRDILRLHASELSQHQISRSLNISSGVVNKYIKLAEEAGVRWPLPDSMGDKEVRDLLMPKKKSCSVFTLPDYNVIYGEFKHKGVTLQLLHEEYCRQNPQSYYSYRQFCFLYHEWKKLKNLSLRQEHKGGDKMFADYAGPTIPIVMNRKTGEVRKAQIFVAVLGASNFTYSEATWSQELENWIGSHVRAFEYFEGVPHLVVPDNLKSGVSHACRYDPDLNPSYAEMIDYYGTAVLPARPYKPKDKAKVENAVLVVERWIMARLRHETFYSLEDLNRRIKELLISLNDRPFKKIEGTRRSLFEQVDRPALKPLPQRPYEYAQFYHRKVTPDYHIEHESHFYSIPHIYVGKEVDIRVTERMIEVLYDGKRIVCHKRHREKGQTTLPEHMPKNHLEHMTWTLEKAMSWASGIGEKTSEVIGKIASNKSHPDQIRRVCLGFYRLEKDFGSKRLEKACQRSLAYHAFSYKSVSKILESGLDKEELDPPNKPPVIVHENIRGSYYYH